MRENKTLQRYEFKYFLTKKIADEIRNHVSKFMILDNFVNLELSNRYFVRSIYFEDNFNTNFDEKINGYRIRKKFRIRYYNKNLNQSPIFLETKGRNLERTYKIRDKIDLSDLEKIKQKKSIFSLINKYPKSVPIHDFVFETYKKNLKPKILIDYERQPFINKHGLYFRLTFDQNLSCVKLNNKLTNNLVNNSLKCKAGFTILEVKFERSIPLWFHRIIQSYNLRRQSISKFVLGMCSTKLGTETSD